MNFPEIPEKAVKLYAKTRTMIRIAALNKAAESRKFIFQENRRNFNKGVNSQSIDEESIEQEDYMDEEVVDENGEEAIEDLLDILDS